MFRCGAHLVNLALGSSERVLRSREPNFILESSRFNEVWVLRQRRTQAPNALLVRPVGADFVSAPRCLGLATGHTHRTRQGAFGPIPREGCSLPSHQMQTPDPLECVRSLTQRGLHIALSPDKVLVRHQTHCRCV